MKMSIATLILCLISGVAVADSISWDTNRPMVVAEFDANGIPKYSAKCSGPLSISAGNTVELLFRKAGSNDTWKAASVKTEPSAWRVALGTSGKWEIKPAIKDGTGKIVAEGSVKTADIPINL